jgi:hypothetical protein
LQKTVQGGGVAGAADAAGLEQAADFNRFGMGAQNLEDTFQQLRAAQTSGAAGRQ